MPATLINSSTAPKSTATSSSSLPALKGKWQLDTSHMSISIAVCNLKSLVIQCSVAQSIRETPWTARLKWSFWDQSSCESDFLREGTARGCSQTSNSKGILTVSQQQREIKWRGEVNNEFCINITLCQRKYGSGKWMWSVQSQSTVKVPWSSEDGIMCNHEFQNRGKGKTEQKKKIVYWR